jgi:hypothetical protein
MLFFFLSFAKSNNRKVNRPWLEGEVVQVVGERKSRKGGRG